MSLNAATIEFLLSKGLSGDDLLEVARRSEMRSDPTAAKRMAEYRERKRATRNVTRNAPPYEDTSTPQPVTSGAGAPSVTVSPRKTDPFPRPEWADKQVWTDFLANRRRKKLTNSPTAYRGFLADVERLADDEWPPGRLLEYAAAKGWGSVNKPEDQRNGRSSVSLRGTRPSPALELWKRGALREAEEALGQDGAADRGAGPSLPSIGTG